MDTSLIDKNKISKDEVIKIASDCLQQKEFISKISGGANNKVFQVGLAAKQYVVKFYFHHRLDSRDRLGVEFNSFSYLWDQGLRLIPRPVAFNRELYCAFYEFIEGKPIGTDISQKDVDRAVHFVEVLRTLSTQAVDAPIPLASEAFFCVKDIVDNIRIRCKRLDQNISGDEYVQLQEYLNKEFMPLFKNVAAWSKKYLQDHGVGPDDTLAQELRTLSPSDFGFHNALRRKDGEIVFLDFEYFGWDDPAKLLSDFLLHPAMVLSDEFKTYFVRRMSKVFSNDPYFQVRLKGLFPLFGLKWCLIFLNEFIPTELKRRDFALQRKNKAAIRLNQLAKAQGMSNAIKAMYKDFPYGS